MFFSKFYAADLYQLTADGNPIEVRDANGVVTPLNNPEILDKFPLFPNEKLLMRMMTILHRISVAIFAWRMFLLYCFVCRQ